MIKGHPDLAGKAARAGTLTSDSKAEQASAGLDRLSEEDFARFHRLNDAYRNRFGIPFIICVRGTAGIRSCSSSSAACCNEPRPRHGRRSTRSSASPRCVSTSRSRHPTGSRCTAASPPTCSTLTPAARPPRSPSSCSSCPATARLIAAAITNRDGRTEQPLIGGQPLPIGRYELRFRVGDYFARRARRQGDPPFLDVVPVRFAVAEPEGHYHVPLLVTPWSYSTYRGS